MTKEERDTPKAQVKAYFVFGFHLGDGVQRYANLAYLSVNNKCGIV